MLNNVLSRGQPDSARPVISAHAWLDLRDQQHRLRRQWRAFFEAFEVLLLPPFGTAAFAHADEADWHRRTLLVDGAPSRFGDQIARSGIATFAGLPATVAPIGHDAEGLPLVVQIVGDCLEDRTTLAVVRQIEAHGRARDGAGRPRPAPHCLRHAAIAGLQVRWRSGAA
jgi:amidase